MKTIWKFDLGIGRRKIEMPFGAEILAVQTQGEIPYLWALVDSDESMVVRSFETFGTGHPIPQSIGIYRIHVGTYQLI